MSTYSIFYPLWVASGCHHSVTCRKGRLGQMYAKSSAGTGDKPDFLIGHLEVLLD
ncbi:hypothetical protein BV349_05543 [Pseudomonas syringae pv. actinidiae]|nr:hypothetical protein BV349_05543 [Pseudomonas syringae pv. actinidiae]OSN65525.1 hypothetical protein BV351_05564 [Pseudomonas syringae pv. actinidiae]RMS48264.1 hypothetical protein ALP64_203487 [Pseudomonas syringae pv. actinidiae]